MVDLKAVGARIKEAREAAHLTQEDLAEKVGVSRTHISVIERGAKAPKLETFVIIANALNVSADTLLLDVVERSIEGTATELSSLIAELPPQEQRRMMKAIRVLLRDE